MVAFGSFSMISWRLNVSIKDRQHLFWVMSLKMVHLSCKTVVAYIEHLQQFVIFSLPFVRVCQLWKANGKEKNKTSLGVLQIWLAIYQNVDPTIESFHARSQSVRGLSSRIQKVGRHSRWGSLPPLPLMRSKKTRKKKKETSQRRRRGNAGESGSGQRRSMCSTQF